MSDIFDNWPKYDPALPSGMNTTDINGDEIDGPGINEPVWPVYIDTFEAFPPVIMGPDHMDSFNYPADLVIAHENTLVVIQREVRKEVVGSGL